MKDPVFGPVYCAMYPDLAEEVRLHGYALAIHGSLARDVALTNLETTAMWAIKAVVCNDPESVMG